MKRPIKLKMRLWWHDFKVWGRELNKMGLWGKIVFMFLFYAILLTWYSGFLKGQILVQSTDVDYMLSVWGGQVASGAVATFLLIAFRIWRGWTEELRVLKPQIFISRRRTRGN